jgi:hypothetical protein
MCCLTSLHKKRAHGIRGKKNRSAPKRLFFLFFVLASVKVLFLPLFSMMQRPSPSHAIDESYFFYLIMSVMIIPAFCKQKFDELR